MIVTISQIRFHVNYDWAPHIAIVHWAAIHGTKIFRQKVTNGCIAQSQEERGNNKREEKFYHQQNAHSSFSFSYFACRFTNTHSCHLSFFLCIWEEKTVWDQKICKNFICLNCVAKCGLDTSYFFHPWFLSFQTVFFFFFVCGFQLEFATYVLQWFF